MPLLVSSETYLLRTGTWRLIGNQRASITLCEISHAQRFMLPFPAAPSQLTEAEARLVAARAAGSWCSGGSRFHLGRKVRRMDAGDRCIAV